MAKLDTALKKLLKDKGVKKLWFIKNIMEIPPGSYYNWRTNFARFPAEPLAKAAKYFNLSLDEFINNIRP